MEEKSFNPPLELARRLIEFETTEERLDQREAIIQYCRGLIDPRAHVSVKRFKKNPLLLASLKGKGPRICFYAHLDTVGYHSRY